jgi:hypothetical protein
VKAIKTSDTERRVWIDFDECVECYSCLRMAKCPTEALLESPETSSEPRCQRRYFSDPKCDHKSVGFPGRGTEEVKTNDVSGLIRKGEIGVGIEMGRPGHGTSMVDVEKVLKAVTTSLGFQMAPHNAFYFLIENHETGDLKKQYLNERFLSAILEFKVPEDKAGKFLEVLEKVSKEINTVFSLAMFARYQGKHLPMMDIIKQYKVPYTPHAKVNLGLGKPLVEE